MDFEHANSGLLLTVRTFWVKLSVGMRTDYFSSRKEKLCTKQKLF